MKERGPSSGFEETRSGGLKMVETGNLDFHTSDKTMFRRMCLTVSGPEEKGVLGENVHR